MRLRPLVVAAAVCLAGAGCSPGGAGNTSGSDGAIEIPRPDGSPGPTVVLPGDPSVIGASGPRR